MIRDSTNLCCLHGSPRNQLTYLERDEKTDKVSVCFFEKKEHMRHAARVVAAARQDDLSVWKLDAYHTAACGRSISRLQHHPDATQRHCRTVFTTHRGRVGNASRQHRRAW